MGKCMSDLERLSSIILVQGNAAWNLVCGIKKLHTRLLSFQNSTSRDTRCHFPMRHRYRQIFRPIDILHCWNFISDIPNSNLFIPLFFTQNSSKMQYPIRVQNPSPVAGGWLVWWWSWGVDPRSCPRLPVASAYPESCNDTWERFRGLGVAESYWFEEPRRFPYFPVACFSARYTGSTTSPAPKFQKLF